MNVLFIGKYPPIQGGTATAAYWRHNELKMRGVHFEVITTISPGSEYCIDYNFTNEHLHLLFDKTPWHIPYSQLFSEQLVSKALELASNQSFDLVEGNYLLPYGFAAYVVSKIINKPLILRHAGSDLYRVTNNKMFLALLKEMALHARLIITNYESKEVWKKICSNVNLVISNRYVPNPKVFSSNGNHIHATFIGKVTDKWDRAQMPFFHNYLLHENYEGKIRVYSNDSTISVFNDYFVDKGYEVEGKHFVIPDKIPEILRDTKYILVSKIPNGIPEESNIYLEGLASGCIPVCMDSKNISEMDMDYAKYIHSQYEIYREAIS